MMNAKMLKCTTYPYAYSSLNITPALGFFPFSVSVLQCQTGIRVDGIRDLLLSTDGH